MYRSLITIVKNHYRAEENTAELDARRLLTTTLARLMIDA